MDISELALRLILLFFPGIICFYIFQALTTPRERKPHQVFLLTLVFGVFSYLVFMVFDVLWDVISSVTTTDDQLVADLPDGISFLRSLVDPSIKPDWVEIGLVSFVAIFVGLFMSMAVNRKWLHDLAQALRITSRFGDPNLWSFAFNSEEVQWVTLRDLENNFMFSGYVRGFSDIEDPAELLLYEVTVYNETTGEELYKADRMYLSRKRDNLTVEFPNPVTNQEGS